MCVAPGLPLFLFLFSKKKISENLIAYNIAIKRCFSEVKRKKNMGKNTASIFTA